MFQREIRYIKRIHPKKPRYWTQARYFGKLNVKRDDKWVFGDKHTRNHLLKFSWFPIKRHILVQGNASPDDQNLRDYWTKRKMAKAKNLIPSSQKIARKQKGVCLRCGESLFNEEEIHVHHKIGRKDGGENNYGNLELVHLYCHQQIHAIQHGRVTEGYCGSK